MKFSEMFTPGPLLAPDRPRVPPAVADDHRLRGQPQLASVTTVSLARDLGPPPYPDPPSAGCDGRHPTVRPADYVNIRTVLAGLDRLVRNHDGVVGGEAAGDAHKLPGTLCRSWGTCLR